MFERFTDRARRVVVLAQDEARRLDHNYIGTEHILLGLVQEGEGVAAQALEALGIGLAAVRQQVEEIVGRGKDAPGGHIPFTPRAKKVLELSLREALQLGHDYIGTEHILLGLIREGEGVAARVLVSLGANLNLVRQQVIQLLHSHQMEGQEPLSTARLAGPSARLELIVTQRAEAIMGRLDAIDTRLAAIEGHLGIAQPVPPGEDPADEGPADEGPADEGPADEGPADEGPAEAGPAGEGPAPASPPTGT
ncbi:MAG: ATP-dependent Clp protease ATP-binding subunit ClpC [Streptosporangiaceae bacterium]|jgi:ATP-dependent Clp protease ATP-binding subunit ClpA|nr:ATP-dependent Clp protease ATP-binding subunit ClpC [Streptosporangiaceae bacterium]